METKQLPYKGNKIQIKDKKALIPALLGIIVIIFIVCYCIFNMQESNRFKRYLKSNKYNCNSSTCVLNENEKEYSINYKTGELTINTKDYNMVISSTVVNLHENNTNQNCTYKREKSKSGVNESTNNDQICDKKIDEINEEITKYKELLFKGDISLEKIEK